MSLSSRNKVEVGFSMSSMTDIVFLLLIFFIVVSTMVSPNGLKIILPSTAQSQSTTVKNTTVTITSAGAYLVDSKKVAESSLENTILSAVNNKTKKGIVLQADKKTPINQVVKVMNIAYDNELEIVLAASKK